MKDRVNLTHDELVQACKNVGVDLTCGQCASVFWTGVGLSLHTCGLPNDEVVITVGDGAPVQPVPTKEKSDG